MWNRTDLRTTLQFAALFVGACMVPGFCLGAVMGLFGIWKGVNGDQLMLLLGFITLVVGPLFVSMLFAVGSLVPTAFVSAFFLTVSPLFRDVTTTVARVALMITGAICGLLGGALLVAMVSLNGSEISLVPAVTALGGFIAGLAYPYSLQMEERKRARTKLGAVEVQRVKKMANDDPWDWK